MTWHITHKPAYTADFVDLNKNLQQATVRVVEELEQDPVTPRGNTIKKLQGYDNVWRYRLGDFRLIYAVAHDVQMVRLLAIGPRSSVYERFNYRGWDAPDAAAEFGPQLAARPEWMEHPEWFRPEPQEEKSEPLPRRLTPALLGKWRIAEEFHPVLMCCRTEDDLYNLSEGQVPAGVMGRVMDGLYPAQVERIATQPDQVLFAPEDLLAYAEGTLAGFLLRLDETQKPLTNWALAGPTLVKGGPGSGKSTVALYRLRALVEHALEEKGEMPEILFTTYTNALINSSESLLQQLLRNVLDVQPGKKLPKDLRITTLHKTARWIAHSSGERLEMAGREQQLEALHAARMALRPRGFGDKEKLRWTEALNKWRDDYLLEEFEWVVCGQDCQSEEDYLQANRTGRGIGLGQGARQAVWQLYTYFQQHLVDQGLLSWGQLLQYALEQVRAGKFTRRWDYVIVDEAQDLPPVGLALCLELCRNPAGLFLTADANQSLYNRGFRWGSVHKDLNVRGRSRILRRNYRSTAEVAEAAAQILADDPEHDPEAVKQEYVHAGPYPVLYAAEGSHDQAQWIGRNIYEAAKEMRLPLNAAVVLVSSSSVGEPLAAALQRLGLQARFMNSRAFDLNDPAIKVTTLHAAKGLEFPIVAVAHVEDGRLPRETDGLAEEEKEAYLQNQCRLFYVGCTRAMRYLFVSHDRQLPSPFLHNLTDDYWMKIDANEIQRS